MKWEGTGTFGEHSENPTQRVVMQQVWRTHIQSQAMEIKPEPWVKYPSFIHNRILNLLTDGSKWMNEWMNKQWIIKWNHSVSGGAYYPLGVQCQNACKSPGQVQLIWCWLWCVYGGGEQALFICAPLIPLHSCCFFKLLLMSMALFSCYSKPLFRASKKTMFAVEAPHHLIPSTTTATIATTTPFLFE